MSEISPNAVETTAEPLATAASAKTQLASALALPLTSLTAYRGAETVAHFSSASQELSAMLAGCGIYDLGWRGFLRCAGRDRVRWLNGMVTNSVKGLQENTGCYAFVLNAQGRIQGDLNVYWRGGAEREALWLQTDRAQMERLTEHFRRYIIMDQVTLDPCDAWTAIGIAGPEAAKTLAALGLPCEDLLPLHPVDSSWRGHPVVVVATDRILVGRYEIWMETSAVQELWAALAAAGAIECGADAVEQLRVLEGVPAYGVDIGERDLPQETNQTRALSFTKGCYLGQEIVERVRSRGNVHRTFQGFSIQGDIPARGTPILASGKQVGGITSVAQVDFASAGVQTLGLGFIRREILGSKESLTAGGATATAYELPFDLALLSVLP